MKASKLILLIILTLAFGLRLYRLDNPVADWHSWRQADTAAVSRNFLKMGFNLLQPRFDDLSHYPSLKENPEGYRFVEFPIYNLIHAWLAQTFSQFSLEIWGRLISIFASLLSIIFLYLIVQKRLGERVALLAAAIFAFLPFHVYYSRTILPDPMALTASLAALYFFDFSWWLAAIFGALTMLLKPFFLFSLLPIFYLFFRKEGFSKKLFISLLVFWFISLLPFALWRIWMQQFPEGIPQNRWLFNAGNIRFKGAFFYWLFAERIGKLILGYWGLIPFGLGLMVKPGKKEGWFFHFWLAGIFLYFSIVASGNVTHDYYQISFLPIAAIFVTKGIDYFLQRPSKDFQKTISYSLLTISYLFSLAFSWYYVRDFFNINNPAIVKAGQAVDRLVPPDAKVIAPYGGDTAFLYQTNRRGWPVGIEIEKMIKQGATHYVNVKFDQETEYLMNKYQVLEKTDEYVIISLQ